MATQQEIQEVADLFMAVPADDYGRDYFGRKRRAANEKFAALGGQERLDELMADPDIAAEIGRMFPSEGGGFFSGLLSGVKNFAGEAGVKEGLMLAAAASGLNSLGAFGTPAASTAAQTAALNESFASGLGGTGSGLTAANITAGGVPALSGAGSALSSLAQNVPLPSASTGTAGTAGAQQLTADQIASLSGNQAAFDAYQAAGMIPAGVTMASAPGFLSNVTGLSENTLGSLASGASALYGANQAAGSAEDAYALQKQASDAALAEQRRQFDLGQAAQMPWRTAGESALGEQVNLMGLGPQGAEGQLASLMKSPGYEFRLGEGQKALERSAAARGGLFGGATGKALTQYGQDYATGEYGNRLAQLSSLSGQGQSAASGMAGQGTNYAGNVSNLLTGMGNAGAASSIAQGAAKQSGILGAGQALSNLFNPPKQQSSLADLLRGYA